MIRSRCSRLSAAVTAGLLLALAAQPALAAPLAQEAGGDDRWRVIFITAAIVFATMLLCTVGYVFRRAVGVDKPPPVTLLEPGRKITGD